MVWPHVGDRIKQGHREHCSKSSVLTRKLLVSSVREASHGVITVGESARRLLLCPLLNE